MTNAVETTETTETATETATEQAQALAKHLDKLVDIEEAQDLIDSGDYYVLTDDEADEQCKELILETVWAFRPEFLSWHMNDIDVEIIKAIQEKAYEDANEPLTRLIEDVDHFVDDAVRADGRGHFIATYDGHENYETINGTTYYIYKV
jgi:predicted nuclease of restriction endonuclease-like RecB superfamily